MREAWRLQKHTIYNYLHEKGTHLALMVIYTGKQGTTGPDIHKGMEKALTKFKKTYESHQPPA